MALLWGWVRQGKHCNRNWRCFAGETPLTIPISSSPLPRREVEQGKHSELFAYARLSNVGIAGTR